MKAQVAVPALDEGRDVDARRPSSWRSHTFRGGVHALILAGDLDGDVVTSVGARIRELIDRGCRRLILDVSSTGVPGRPERALLAELVDADRRDCRIVLVLPWHLAVREVLPADVELARTLKDARQLFQATDGGAPAGFADRS